MLHDALDAAPAFFRGPFELIACGIEDSRGMAASPSRAPGHEGPGLGSGARREEQGETSAEHGADYEPGRNESNALQSAPGVHRMGPSGPNHHLAHVALREGGRGAVDLRRTILGILRFVEFIVTLVRHVGMLRRCPSVSW
jgi:hypothetical protein